MENINVLKLFLFKKYLIPVKYLKVSYIPAYAGVKKKMQIIK